MVTALFTSTKFSYAKPGISTGIGDLYLWQIYLPSRGSLFIKGHSGSPLSLPSLRGSAQGVLARVSATAGEEMASSA